MNTTDAGYAIWLAQQSHLPFRAYGMDLSKYKCKIQDPSFQKQHEHEHVHRAAVSDLSKRLVSRGDLYASTAAPRPLSEVQTNVPESRSRFPSYGEPIRSEFPVPAPIFPPGRPFPPTIRAAQPILCFPLVIPILPGVQLSLRLSSLSDVARSGNQKVDCGDEISCPLYDDPFCEVGSGNSLIPRNILQDEDCDDAALEDFTTREGGKHCDYCRETFSRSLAHQDPSTKIFTRRALCEGWHQTPSPIPMAHQSRSHDGTPYHRLIKDIDFQDEIFVPDFFDEGPRVGSSRSPLMTGIQYQEPHVRGCPCHQRSATADSAVSFSLPVNDLSVDKWRSRATHIFTACNNHNSNTGNDIKDTVFIYETENRKQEIPRLSGWRHITTTSSVSSQASTLTGSSPNTPTPNNRDSWRESRSAEETASQIRAKQLEMMAKHGPGIFQPFIPSRAIIEEAEEEAEAEAEKEDSSPAPHSHLKHTSAPHPSPPPYHHPYSTPLIPASQNTALWLTGIPSSATYNDVLASIRGGRIYICALNPPIAGTHSTAACKLVFFTRAAAERFLARANHSIDGICVKGERIKCIWNRILYPEYRQERQSRVLLIRGEARLMSFEFFEEFFRARFKGDLEARFEIESRSRREVGGAIAAAAAAGRRRSDAEEEDQRGWKTYVWRFASLRAQAELAKVALEREMGGIFQVEYGADPCERPW